jgi:hypothetical protein
MDAAGSDGGRKRRRLLDSADDNYIMAPATFIQNMLVERLQLLEAEKISAEKEALTALAQSNMERKRTRRVGRGAPERSYQDE